METAIVVNPVGGRGRALKLVPRIKSMINPKNGNFKIFTTRRPGDGYNLGRLCLVEGYKRIVVIGGDGTINEVGSAIAGTDMIMGVLPGGSGNDFFKMLISDKNKENMMEAAFGGNPKEVDVGIVNDKPFFNSVGIGFDAEVALRFTESEGTGGIWLYLKSVLKSLKTLKPILVEVDLDKYSFSGEITLICVGNGRSSGGGFYLTPNAAIDDSLFDICVIGALPKRQIFKYLPKTLNGSHTRLDKVSIYRSKRVVIKSSEKLPVHIDGEPYKELSGKLTFRISDKKLRVAVHGD